MRQQRLYFILSLLFLGGLQFVLGFLIFNIENDFSIFNLLLIVTILGIIILIGKRLPENIEEVGIWTDDEQTLIFIETIEFYSKKTREIDTQIPINEIKSIYLIREDYSWTLCVKSFKSKKYIECIVFLEMEIIDKLVEKGFFNQKTYYNIINQPRTFKLKMIDYFDFLGFPKFELYNKKNENNQR